jgi:hypothetical protein
VFVLVLIMSTLVVAPNIVPIAQRTSYVPRTFGKFRTIGKYIPLELDDCITLRMYIYIGYIGGSLQKP